MSNEAIETEIIGDAAVATDNITPSTYFEYVKGMKDKIDDTDHQLVIDNILKMIDGLYENMQGTLTYEQCSSMVLSIVFYDSWNGELPEVLTSDSLSSMIGSLIKTA